MLIPDHKAHYHTDLNAIDARDKYYKCFYLCNLYLVESWTVPAEAGLLNRISRSATA
jgi:hypothetical protein